MDLRHLRYFVTVAETGLVTRAAECLNVSQPPLSRAIRELEIELGIDLFWRQKQRLVLTAVGEMLLEDARAILGRADGFKLRAQSLSSGEQGRIRVGYVDGAMQGGLLATQLRRLRLRCPLLKIDLVPLSSEMQLRRVAEGAIDAGIIYTPLSEHSDAVVHPLLADRMLLGFPADHKLAAKRQVHPAALDGAPWIVTPREGDAAWRGRFTDACGRAGFQPEIRYEVSQLSALLGLVEAGAGLAFVPASVTRMQTPGIKFRSLPWWTQTVDFWLAWRKRDPSPPVRQLLLANEIPTASSCAG